MAQTGYTPIQLYLSTTASVAPSAGNLANGELAINITDGKLFYKDNSGVVQVLATKGAGTIGGSNTQVQYNSSGALAGSANLTFDGTTLTAAGLAGPHNGTVGATTPNTGAFTTLSASGAVTLSGGTANGVAYLNGSKVLTTGSALSFNGTNFYTTAQIYGGAGSANANIIASSNVANGGAGYSQFLFGNTSTDTRGYLSYSHASDALLFGIASSEQMRLTSTGLGIGTSSPAYKLDLQGGRSVFSPVSEKYALGLRYNTSTNGVWLGSPSADAFTISSFGGAEYLRLDSSGNLLVGTTSAPANRGALIVRRSTTATTIGNFFNDSSDPYGVLVNYSAAAPNDASHSFFYGADNSANRFFVYSNGGIANYSGNNVNLSDRREKTNFAPAGSYLDKICAIPVQTFNYIDQNLDKDPGLTLGVVAQDVQAVAPELVMESNWGTQDDPKQRLSIYQTDLQYALMKCIQEQQALITTLTARVAALESN